MDLKNNFLQKLANWRTLLKKFAVKIALITRYYSKKFYYRLRNRAPQLKKDHFLSFPATHLKPMDGLDFFVKFSTELIVLSLAIAVFGFNVFLFHSSAKTQYTDNSLAARLLSYHPQLNNLLYNKNTSIITTITKPNSFIAQAQAEDFIGLNEENAAAAAAPSNDSETTINQDGLVKPNPDSIQSLIDKQVKVYQTKTGDTLASIAAANGISVQTIMWANNLTSPSIQPGWFLIILPADGVLVKATSNDTLPDLAARYNPEKYNPDSKTRSAYADQLLEKIISYNGLANAEDIDTNQLIIIPGGKILQPPAQRQPKISGGKVGGNVQPPANIDNGNGHIFPWGYCTWYVASKVNVPWGGNAKNWLANAKAYGAVISNQPTAGAVVVTTDNRRYGHVALVESVDDAGFIVSEMNFDHFGKIDTRWIPKDSRTIRGFIYP